MKNKILSKIYDVLYEEADRILKKYNPCKFKRGKCLRGEFCCDYCPHLSSKGCKVKALWCKLWLCPSASQKNRKCSAKLLIISNIAEKLNLLGYRNSKSEIMERFKRG